MKPLFIILLLFSLLLNTVAAGSSPYENGKVFKPRGRLDQLLQPSWQKHNIPPAKMASDGVFLRRVYLDLIGTIPTRAEAKAFLKDNSPDKRSKLIDQLLERKEFAQYWSLKWCDILRVKSEFPINLWPNAVQAYHHWVWQAIEEDLPYDKFARELLTASGSNFREPQVNFYRATQNRSPSGFAKVAVQTFLCSRISDWPKTYRQETEKLFSRLMIKGTDEWKEQIVCLNPEPGKKMTVRLPDGTILKVGPDQDPRQAFANWLIDGRGNKWFTQAAVNRVWFWFFGRGIVHEPDNLVFKKKGTGPVNAGNPPVNPQLLNYLATEFKKSGYDFKALCRLITNSATYQQSCIPNGELSKAEKYFAVYPVRRLDAEVLVDTLSYLSGTSPKYVSVIPEPFTYIPPEHRTIALADGSISSSFLETFGRPARDTGYLSERNNATTYSQRLFLLNSPTVQWRIPGSQLVKEAVKDGQGNPKDTIDNIYLLILSRYPSLQEYLVIKKHYQSFGISPGRKRKRNQKNQREAGRSLIWALLNSKEFVFRH